MNPDAAFHESIALDAAYLRRGVPALIESLATQAMQELDNVGRVDDGGNPAPQDNAAVL